MRWVLAVVVATGLACGGLPIPGTEPEVPADGVAASDTDVPVVPVPVDSGTDAKPAEPTEPEPAEPAPGEEPTEPKPAEPKPDPKPDAPKPAPDARTPDPKPAEPAPKPAPGGDDDGAPAPKPVTGPKGTVKVEGPGRVVLFNQELGRFPVPGDVPVGSYVIRVKFGEKPVVATGRVKVTESGVTIKCNESMGLCRGQ